MKKLMLLLTVVALFLQGCSTTTVEQCHFEDMPSGLFSQDGDVEVYLSTKCNTDYLTFYNNSQEYGYQCEVIYNDKAEEFNLAMEESKEVSFAASFDPVIDYHCLIVEVMPKSTSATNRWKMADGVNYFSYRNTSDFKQTCRFYDAEQETIVANMTVKPGEWTDWFKVTSGDYFQECEVDEYDEAYKKLSNIEL
ncbi:MAG TPA: hypothetical protein DCL21_04065 [Alphaproteobacteria bacterium]|nr:hypothetical protein [Alphaproteobacteria bacterium]